MREQMTYDEIARHFRISVTRVQRIEQRALRKLRKGLLKRGVTSGDVRRLLTS
jgi:DNA-directed RNA polymerase specialized sigma24 family protein